MLHCNAIGCVDAEPLQMCQGRPVEYPSLAAMKQHNLHNHLIEVHGNAMGGIFSPEHLPNASLRGSSFPQLIADPSPVYCLHRGVQADTPNT
jgi:hypothetical protein